MAGDDVNASVWPPLPYDEWRETRDTLHMYIQVIGKLRLALSPFEPEWGNVALYVTARGLTTSPMPVGLRALDAELDLIDHILVLRSSDGLLERRPLGGTVAEFFADVMGMLDRLSVAVPISPAPSEVRDPIPFADDRVHATYEPEQATRFFRVLSAIDLVMKEYHAGFNGRTTPVHFFWGAFDLAVTRHSARRLHPPSGGGVMERFTRDAEEVCSGWWPGDERFTEPAFYAYAEPLPRGFERSAVQPPDAYWDAQLGEFILPYGAVRQAADPRRAALDFFDSTYAAGAALMGWDPELTHVPGPPRRTRVSTSQGERA